MCLAGGKIDDLRQEVLKISGHLVQLKFEVKITIIVEGTTDLCPVQKWLKWNGVKEMTKK